METKNLDIYGDPPIPWSRALELLEAPPSTQAPRTTWLSTIRPEGRPHLAGVGALWVDGKFYFTSGPGARKSRNLAANPNCALSMELRGLDLVVEGRAAKVTDQATLERLAQLRAPAYEAVADATIDTEQGDVADVARAVLDELAKGSDPSWSG